MMSIVQTGFGNPPDWDAIWAAADLPDVDRDAWRTIMGYRMQRPDDAVLLAKHGWTPRDVLAARQDPEAYWPEMRVFWPARLTHSPERMVALAVLASETAAYHDNQAGIAREIRAQYIRQLSEGSDSALPWSHERIGQALRLTRQRVRMILKRKAL